MTFFTTTRLLSALLLAAIAVPAAASAAQPGNDISVAVSTTGLDTSKPADRAMLRHRIAVAANQVCSQVAPGDALSSSGFAECFGRAKADAKAQLDAQIANAGSRTVVASISQ